MGTVRLTQNEDYKPSEESLARLVALKDRPIDYSDIPENTPEEIEIMIQRAMERRKQQKQMFSLRLQKSTINWWKSLGSGYTGIMARLLDKAREHPEWIKTCL